MALLPLILLKNMSSDITAMTLYNGFPLKTLDKTRLLKAVSDNRLANPQIYTNNYFDGKKAQYGIPLLILRKLHQVIPQKHIRYWLDSLSYAYKGPKTRADQLVIPVLRKEVEDHFFKSTDELTLHGWYLPAKKNHPTILYAPGNQTPLKQLEGGLLYLKLRGFGLFTFEYRGMGMSQGLLPNEKGMYKDLESASHYLAHTLEIPLEKQILAGASLGSGVVTHVAQNKPYKAILLFAPFTNLPSLLGKLYKELKLPLNYDKFVRSFSQRFDSESKIHNVKSPLMIVHSKDDVLTPPEMSVELFSKATGARKKRLVLYPHGNHAGWFNGYSNNLYQQVRRFI